jgi:uncharacterized protein
MVRSDQKGILLSLIFLIMLYLFTRGFYPPFFICLLALFLLIAFLKEEMRLVDWMIISYFLGNLLIGYMDKFIESFRLSPYSLVIASQFLWLIPILFISYVIKQFKKDINSYFQKTNLTREIQLPINIIIPLGKLLLLIGLAFVLIIGLLFMIKSGDMHWRPFLFILLFSTINAVLEEVLWRGIFLSKLISITNQRIGILVTSIAFGLNTTMFGFSIFISIFYMILGLFLGYITVKSKSNFPSIMAHTLVTTIFAAIGWVVIPL